MDYLKKDKIKISRKTIYNYLNFLQEACLIYKVPRKDLECKRILKLEGKYYVVDYGFYQAFVGRNEANISKILEKHCFHRTFKKKRGC